VSIAALLLTHPALAVAQDAFVTGTVTDAAGKALPAVAIAATELASGETIAAATDANGAYRIPLRTGSYQMRFVAPGFATIERTGIELLLGQQGVVNVQMVISGEPRTITVTGEVQLQNGGGTTNIDERQTSEIPLNGRNATDLGKTAVGNRQTQQSDEPVDTGIGTFQLNVDGQRLTQNMTAGFGQVKYSRDALGQIEYVTNRFDATQGGTSGIQMNAVTRSGTNQPGGTFSGYFRDDKMDAADFVAHRVLTYQDQQLTGTFGGPIVRDRVHYFANYEYERSPQDFTFSSPYAAFNQDLIGTYTSKTGGGRLDFQISPQVRFAVRGNDFGNQYPYDPRYTGGASRAPNASLSSSRHSDDYLGILTQVLSPQLLNQATFGYASFYWVQTPIVNWPNCATAGFVVCHPYPTLSTGSPLLNLRGYTIGNSHTNSYQRLEQDTISLQDQLTWSYRKGGAHTLKLGGSHLHIHVPLFLCNQCMGVYDMTGGQVPPSIQADFPNMFDESTWNLAALSSITKSVTLGVGQMYFNVPMTLTSGWAQDDWKIGSRLTLNLGLRYDYETGVYSEEVGLLPFLPPNRPNEKDEIAPRIGFAYRAAENTVVRGGVGLYYADPGSNTAYWTHLWSSDLTIKVINDGRPDFAANPFNGPVPTYDQALATLCYNNHEAPGCLRRTIPGGQFPGPINKNPYSWQTSIGVQHQLAKTTAFAADLVGNFNRRGNFSVNQNLSYDPSTGANYAFTDLSHLPFPDWQAVLTRLSSASSDYMALQAGITKRMANHWQASATYLLSYNWLFDNVPVAPGCQYPTTSTTPGTFSCSTPITLQPDISENGYYLDPGQRQKVTVNGIWQLPYGFQLSGVYLFGDQGWATPTYGVDVRNTGNVPSLQRLVPTGTLGCSSTSTAIAINGLNTPVTYSASAGGCLVSRNAYDISSIKKLDVRLTRRFRIGPKATVDGIVEMFNVLNTANYQSYVTNLSATNYGAPSASSNIQYYPRMVQLGFRATF
jgi:hypothetical protein